MNPDIPLFQRIRSYGSTVYSEAARYCEASEKLAVAREQLKFNLRCKRNNVLPKSLKFQPPIRTQEGYRCARRTGFRYL